MVSIIIPHYNRSVLLKKTVDSVLQQTSAEWELIIVDDGSDEKEFNSILSLKELAGNIKIIKRQSSNKGPSACRNEGVAVSKGGLIIFLDSDDALAPWCVEQRSVLMNKNHEVDMGIFLMQEFTTLPGDSMNIFNNLASKNNPLNYFIEGINPWAVTCPVWRRNFFVKIGGFDELFFYMEDPELHVRALLQPGMEYKTFYDTRPDCYYRINFHDETKSNFYENSVRYRILFYKKVGGIISATPELLNLYKNSFENGVVNFFKNFLIARMKKFPKLRQDFMKWANESGLLATSILLKMRILSYVVLKDNRMVKMLRLKGLTLKLLFPKVKYD